MVKHIQTIRRQRPSNCLSVFDNFVGLPLEGLRNTENISALYISILHYLIIISHQSLCGYLLNDERPARSYFYGISNSEPYLEHLKIYEEMFGGNGEQVSAVNYFYKTTSS